MVKTLGFCDICTVSRLHTVLLIGMLECTTIYLARSKTRCKRVTRVTPLVRASSFPSQEKPYMLFIQLAA